MNELRKAAVRSSDAGLPPGPRPPLPGLRPIVCGRELCRSPEEAASREWIVTNGLGGYASSTILGMNTRRSHGLLVAAVEPPLRRMVLLSKVEETIVAPGYRFELSTNRYASAGGGMVHPEGFKYLEEFRLDPSPTFFYRVGNLLLEKTVFMLPGENATVVGYTLHDASGPIELVVRPLVAMRGLEELRRESADFQPKVEHSAGIVVVKLLEELPLLMIHHTAELAEPAPCWYNHFEYTQDGVKEQEDLWSFGVLRFLLKAGESISLVASTGRRGTGDYTFHRRRLENTQTVLAQNLVPPGSGPLASRLTWTADSFVAWRPPAGQKAVVRLPLAEAAGQEAFLLSGFPRSTLSGRDALVALPGLAIHTRQLDLARATLLTLASELKDGLIPVRWTETNGAPEYDSADTSLWFFWAVWHYWRVSRDLRFVAKRLLDPLREIMEGYLEGTKFGIVMDDDGLIRLSDREKALTWMDARLPAAGTASGPAVTPRWGKPVEVNALWYGALTLMSQLADRLGFKQATHYDRLARLVGQNFVRTFYGRGGFLFDRVTEEGPDASIRPNMLIAVGLPLSPLSRAQGLRVLEVAEKHLLTPAGLRTLSPEDPNYRGRWERAPREQALAAHQGTVWSWLTGSYVSAVCGVRGLTRSTQTALARQLKPALAQLEGGCLGTLGESFDGDPPHQARGRVSQAISVGEFLRAVREARLGGL